MATTYPSIASTFSIGKSHEGRDMRVIKVKIKQSKLRLIQECPIRIQIGAAGTNKKGFWIDATIHAREWITSGTINYIINEVIYSKNCARPVVYGNIFAAYN